MVVIIVQQHIQGSRAFASYIGIHVSLVILVSPSRQQSRTSLKVEFGHFLKLFPPAVPFRC
jgi:hypothetical protein